jgi:hypothetical protein
VGQKLLTLLNHVSSSLVFSVARLSLVLSVARLSLVFSVARSSLVFSVTRSSLVFSVAQLSISIICFLNQNQADKIAHSRLPEFPISSHSSQWHYLQS